MIGVAKADSVIEIGQLEHAVRDVLNRTAQRRFAVLDPLKVVIENYPEGRVEEMDVVNNPEDAAAGTRKVAVLARAVDRARRLHGGAAAEVLPPGAGREVRLRSAYFVTCTEVVKDAAGEVVELRCTYDPATRGGDSPDGRRPKATLHWVSAAHAVAGRGPAVRPPVLAAGSGRGRARPVRRPEPRLRVGAAAGASSSLRWPKPRSARPCSSSGSATSAPDPDTRPDASSSTGR